MINNNINLWKSERIYSRFLFTPFSDKDVEYFTRRFVEEFWNDLSKKIKLDIEHEIDPYEPDKLKFSTQIYIANDIRESEIKWLESGLKKPKIPVKVFKIFGYEIEIYNKKVKR